MSQQQLDRLREQVARLRLRIAEPEDRRPDPERTHDMCGHCFDWCEGQCPVERAYRRGCVQALGLLIELVYERAWSERQARALLEVLRRYRAEHPVRARSWLLHEATRDAMRRVS